MRSFMNKKSKFSRYTKSRCTVWLLRKIKNRSKKERRKQVVEVSYLVGVRFYSPSTPLRLQTAQSRNPRMTGYILWSHAHIPEGPLVLGFRNDCYNKCLFLSFKKPRCKYSFITLTSLPSPRQCVQKVKKIKRLSENKKVNFHTQ